MRSLTLVALVACAAAADPVRTPPEPARAEPAAPAGVRTPVTPELQVKQIVDRYRAAVGLPPVVLDAGLSKGCMEHAAYMRQNQGTDAMAGLNAHTQRPELPGATPAGAKCAKAADLFPGVSDLGAAVDGWMSGLYHRRPILAPPLARIGVGYAKLADGSYMAALMFVDGLDGNNAARWPVAYPAANQTAIPLDFGDEIPNPVPGGGRAGYPITLQFPPFDKVAGVTAKLVDAAGKDVPFYLSSPEHPATSFGQYGVICVIPKLPLAPRTTYTVTISATWKAVPNTYSWKFTTLSLVPVDAHDEAAVVASLGVAATLRGTVQHGGMMNSETAFLQIGERQLKNYKMISVLIPKATMAQLGTPASFVGKRIEADGTPHLVQGQYINVTITVPSQLRVVAGSP